MRVVVIGATGNVGTSVLRSLSSDPDIQLIRGLARRLPRVQFPNTEFHSVDIASSPLVPLFREMDAVIHLGWQIQSAHQPAMLERNNVHGSRRVFEAVAEAGVPALLYASSIGAYSKGPKDQRVSETWPTEGIPSSLYSRQKVAVERALDAFEARHPQIRCVRMRPALIFKRDAGSEIRRLFLAPWWPRQLFDPRRIKLVPYHPRLCFQAVHSFDVGDAFWRALKTNARGAFNLASDQVLTSAVLASEFGARQVPLSQRFLRSAAALSWHLRLQHSDPGWVDLGLDSPLIDSTRAHKQLGWAPTSTSLQALRELLHGIRDGAGLRTPPLAPPFQLRRSG